MNIIYKDAMTGVKSLDDNTINCCITSPPYFQARNYKNNPLQIGLENNIEEYIKSLLDIFDVMKDKLKDDGNLFINIGDKYDKNKNLMLIPSRFALEMQKHGWILRNDIIWYKPNFQPSPVKDRLTNSYEHIYHFVKNKKYYYNLDSVRIKSHESSEYENEKAYNKFKIKILESNLSDIEKDNALQELDILYSEGKITKDARLKIRDGAKKLFGSDVSLSGRAKELQNKGFFFHCNNPKGKNPGDILFVNIKSHKGSHEAVFPSDLIYPLINISTKEGDLVLDMFAGTGTTLKVANELGRNAVGFDINEY